jgi:site-specific DNA recombinase
VDREVWSGGDRHRPALDALLDRLGPGDTVLCYALDRLSRSQVDTAILIDRIEATGAQLALATEDFERSATGTFLRNAKAFVAELEKEKIAERTQRGMRARIGSGKPLVGSKPPFGYRWSDSGKTHLVLDAETAPVARLVFDWALGGASLRTIVTRLAERGIPSPTGLPHWTPPVIRDLLLRPIYAGYQEAYTERIVRGSDGKERRYRRPAEERIIVPDVAPPIITPQERAAVVSRLTQNKATATRNNRNPNATLLRCGFARCGHCGRSLAVQNPASTRPAASPVYRCDPRDAGIRGCPRPSISSSVLDPIVWEKVATVLRDPEIIAREVARQREDGSLARDLAAVERMLATVVDKQARIVKRVAAIDDDDVAAPLMAELHALAASKKAAERERDDLRRRVADAEADTTRLRSLREWCQTVAANLDALTYDERRLALGGLGVTVQIWRPGSTDERGKPFPRWQIELDPTLVASPAQIVSGTA